MLLMEALGVFFELFGEGAVVEPFGARDFRLGNVHEKLALKSAATDENGKMVGTAVGEGEAGGKMATFDYSGERYLITDVNVAIRTAYLFNAKLLYREDFPGIKGRIWGKKSKL